MDNTQGQAVKHQGKAVELNKQVCWRSPASGFASPPGLSGSGQSVWPVAGS